MNSEKQKPLYMQIKQYIKNAILEEKYQPKDKLPTEKELMDLFDVSRITVANALSELSKEGWINRIPGRGTFVNQLSSNEEKTFSEKREVDNYQTFNFIALVIPTLEDLFALNIVNGIQTTLKGSGYHLTIVLTDNSKELERKVIIELINKGVKGLIIFPADAQTYNEEILALKMNKFPFVLIDRDLPGVETHFVSSNSYLGAQLAVNYLWEQGHRNISISSDSFQPTTSVSERISGYMEALRKKGSLIDPKLILTDFSKIDQEHPLYQLIKSQKATAFITLNAKLGLYIQKIARQFELKVPEDLSIITFDDPRIINKDVNATFTHIDQSEFEMGKESAEILLKVIQSPLKYQDRYEKILLEPHLVIKDSVASPPRKLTLNSNLQK